MMMPRMLTSPLFAVGAACTGSGLLFLGRGGFLPYFFAIYQELTPLGYEQIAVLLNLFVLTQALFAPFAGYFTDRLPRSLQALTAILLHCSGLAMIVYLPEFLPNILGTMLLSIAFIVSKIGFNAVMLEKSDPSKVRRVVSFRAVLMNGGSFAGNLLAARVGTALGYRTHLVCLAAVMFAAWTLLLLYREPTAEKKEKPAGKGSSFRGTWGGVLRNRPFLADLLRIVSVSIPYGCWGTIIPKFLMDTYGSVEIIPLVYMTSFLTIVLGTHLFNEFIARYLYSKGFRRRSWFPVTIVLYLSGLSLLTFAHERPVMILGVCIFMLGEISMPPCFDEAVVTHGKENTGFHMGVLQVTDAGGRVSGSAIAFAVYGYMARTEAAAHFWPVIVFLFAVLSAGILRAASMISAGTVPCVSSAAGDPGRKKRVRL